MTTGFDVWTDYQKSDGKSAEISFRYYGNKSRYTVIVTLEEGGSYSVTLDGKEIPFNKRTAGAIEITLDGNIKQGILSVKGRNYGKVSDSKCR